MSYFIVHGFKPHLFGWGEGNQLRCHPATKQKHPVNHRQVAGQGSEFQNFSVGEWNPTLISNCARLMPDLGRKRGCLVHIFHAQHPYFSCSTFIFFMLNIHIFHAQHLWLGQLCFTTRYPFAALPAACNVMLWGLHTQVNLSKC